MDEKKGSYLSRLKFDPRLRNTWWGRYLTNIRFVVLLILAIVIAGVYSYQTVPRRVNPEVKIPIIIVSTVLPGASPKDIESLVTIPIEDKLDNVKGVDSAISISKENVSIINLQFLSNIDGEKALSDVQTSLSSGLNLPSDTDTPVVKLLDFEDQPIWTFAVTSKSDEASLMRFARGLRDDLEKLGKIDRVELSGVDKQEIQVILKQAAIAKYGINPVSLIQLVKLAVTSYPAGEVGVGDFSFPLTIDREVIGVEDVRNLLMDVDGVEFRLGEVAEVVNRGSIGANKSYLVKDGVNRRAVEFFVFKSKDANIDGAESDARKLVDKRIGDYKENFELTNIMNTADDIVTKFDELFREFGVTIFLVFVLLVVFLGFRQALISLLTVPLTLLSAMVVIKALGLSLNFLTAFAFLIALGLLIDDTIVTVAAMTRYYLTGKFTPAETAMLVWRDFIVPLWSMTITVIWAFVPLLLSTGIIGEFIKSIPIIVTATMISSTAIAVFITLPVMVVLLKPDIPRRVAWLLRIVGVATVIGVVFGLLPKNEIFVFAFLGFLVVLFIGFVVRKDLGRSIDVWMGVKIIVDIRRALGHGIVNIERLSDAYKGVIEKVLYSKSLRRKTIFAVVAFAVVGYMLVPLGLVKSEFFPKTDEDILYIQVDLPEGTSESAVRREMVNFEKSIKFGGEIDYFAMDTGKSLSENGDIADSTGSFLITVHLLPEGIRKVASYELAERLRADLASYSKGDLKVLELSGGPPAGADIQISVLGDDLSLLNKYAKQVADWLSRQSGVTNVQLSSKEGTGKLVFVPDKSKLKDAGMSVEGLGLWLRSYASGLILETIKIDSTDTDIRFLLNKDEGQAEDLASLSVPKSDGGSIPLLSLGSLKLNTNPSVITRRDGRRQITISAGARAGVSSAEKSAELVKFVDGITMPEGYTWETGGVNEENEKSVQSILQAMILSFILILVTMVVEFRSYRQTLIALMIIPLGVTGVFYVFALTGTPLSFPALIGILALFGIVVRHVIIVIEKINDNRAHGMELRPALVDAAGSRLEPVLLTSLAAIAGLIPITISDPLWRGLGGAIIAGLLFSGVIKLFFVPVVYFEWFARDEKVKKENKKKRIGMEK